MNARTISVLFAATLFAACSKEDGHAHAPGDTHSATGDSGNAEHHDDHGDTMPLGAIKLGGITVQVGQEKGPVEPGKDVGIDVTFEKGKPLPATVRGWLGTEDAKGSTKAKLSVDRDTTMHAHLEVPKPIPSGAKIWVEIDGASPARGSIDFKK